MLGKLHSSICFARYVLCSKLNDIVFCGNNKLKYDMYSNSYCKSLKNNILFGQGEALLSYSHKIKDIKSTITTFEKSLQTVSDAIQKNNVSEKLEGKEIKSVMTF